MGAYRASDLRLLPNLVSLVRVPLALVFPFTLEWPAVSLGVIALAGASDVLDGHLARVRGEVTATGAVVDPVTDKLFVITVVLSLVIAGRIPVWGLPLLAARDLGELPLVAFWALSRRHRRARIEHPIANLPGKLATALQFGCVAAALLAPKLLAVLLVATGLVGVIAALSYWRRELEKVDRSRADRAS